MLYIFLVDSGTMMTFDMDLALQTVDNLKTSIQERCRIPKNKQVLLISGGENLKPSSRVCSYSAAGTDTNPIFLFNLSALESNSPPIPTVNYNQDLDMRERIDSCKTLLPTYNTVVARTELAKQLHDLAKEQFAACEKLIHDQHLQHQGWSAVVANLEDNAGSLEAKCTNFEETLKSFLRSRDSHYQLIDKFNESLELLKQVPLIPALKNSWTSSQTRENDRLLTLWDWISDNSHKRADELRQMAEQCLKKLEQFDENSCSQLMIHAKSVLKSASLKAMKEIGGIENRFSVLDEVMHDARNIVKEQSELAQGFAQNQVRASSTPDPSILATLCNGHQRQLDLMSRNHQKLRDIRRRCVRSKEELSNNLHERLQWIVRVENDITKTNNDLLFCRELIKQLNRMLEVIQQLQVFPSLYLQTVVEVVRRRNFSTAYLGWATSLSEECRALYEKEMSTRTSFNETVSHHFLKRLFPGLDDLPSPFANDPPPKFDSQLPMLTQSDIQYLKEIIPSMAHLLELPESVPMPTAVGWRKAQDPTESDTDDFETVSSDGSNSIDDAKGASPDAKQDFSSNEDHVDNENEDSLEPTQQNEDEAERAAQLTTKCDASVSASLNEHELSELHLKVEALQKDLDNKCNELTRIETDLSSSKEKQSEAVQHTSSVVGQARNYLSLAKTNLGTLRSHMHRLNDELKVQLTDAKSQVKHLGFMYEEMVTTMSARHESEANELRAKNTALTDDLNNCTVKVKDLSGRLEAATLNHEKEIEEYKEQLKQIEDNADRQVKQLILGYETNMEQLKEENAKILSERDEEIKKLSAELDSKVTQLKSILQDNSKLKDQLLSIEDAKNSIIEQRDAERKDFEEQLATINKEWEEKEKKWEEEKTKALQTLREELLANHKHEIEALKSRYRLQVSITSLSSMDRTPSNTSLEKVQFGEDVAESVSSSVCCSHERLVQTLNAKLNEQRLRHEQLLQEKDEEVRVKIQAGKQKAFNEAMEKLSREKDSLILEKDALIRELECREAFLRNTLDRLKGLVQQNPQSQAQSSSSSTSTQDTQEAPIQREESSGPASSGIGPSSSSSPSSTSSQSDHAAMQTLIQSIKDVIDTATCKLDLKALNVNEVLGTATCGNDGDASLEPGNVGSQIEYLKHALRDRDAQIAQLNQRLLCISGMASTISQSDRISVFTCEVGDAVLLCYEEKHQSYVVFLLNAVPHFLHTDCLEHLKLLPGEDGSRKTWALVEITDKEYCLAKKENNRYRVRKDTKFYRVKAKLWPRAEEFLRRMEERNRQLSSITSCPQSPSSPTKATYAMIAANTAATPRSSSFNNFGRASTSMSASVVGEHHVSRGGNVSDLAASGDSQMPGVQPLDRMIVSCAPQLPFHQSTSSSQEKPQ